ncbi:hypothetical protein HUJ04_008685 [Dendroctonus ponderosae]|uniref:MutL C-terminal dimerisation domain-containing protein n=2 Tax=Dendroctonus ponderosae TaxID=77166 RepID=A0AAR5Q164_DENPD|nr:hypothetical protein HUJ04_008685 [Dendroctonus ponderosae]
MEQTVVVEEQPEHLPTAADSTKIRPINTETVHRICAGQVVLSLAIAMKELVENAIDAGATIIDIHLKEYGSELLEVADNGNGVHRSNFPGLALKHCTSKLSDFDDLERLGTLGFRGEALSSLCALADVEITTKHGAADSAARLSYDHGGNIVSEEVAARQRGTTVSLRNIFAPLPVRRKEFTKNLKREFSKMCNLLYAYCLLPNGIKYSCSNTTAKGAKSSLVATEGHKTVRENVISVFGLKQLASLLDVPLALPGPPILEEYGVNWAPGDKLPFSFDFLVSSALHGSGRSSADHQFFYINHRPCEPSKIIKLVNELYRQFNNKQYPFVFLDIATTSCMVDVNITPDKRQVFLEKEKLLLASVKASLLEAFKELPATLVSNTLEVSRGLKRHATEVRVKNTSILDTFRKRPRSEGSSKLTKNEAESKSVLSARDVKDSELEADEKLEMLVEIACNLSKHESDDEPAVVDIDGPQQVESQRRQVPLKLNYSALKEKFLNHLENQQQAPDSNTVHFRSDIAPEANKAAEEELSRHIAKEDFAKMAIIGQFNLGFIVTKLQQDLFIVDQHATDEKYNFEQLQRNSVMDSQKLVNPKLLELTAAARSTLIEHEEVFKKNGFSFETGENIFLTSIPIGEGCVLGKPDIDEMIFMLQEDDSRKTMCRPSRVRSVFASRACRKSVMIGKSLSRTEMKNLVAHMGDIEQPWNCPHGRPTMRHLVNLSLLTEQIEPV